MKSKYGPKFKEFNKWFKKNKHLLFCESCYQQGFESPAHVVHHIVRAGKPFSDNPHFWMILDKTCHWYCRVAKQDFEFNRLIEWEEEWLKEKSVYRWIQEGIRKDEYKNKTELVKCD